MKTVRAKFQVQSITEFAGGDKRIEAFPVMGGSEENKSFSKYSPSGKLELTISSETEAQNFFAPGKSFYLDFSEAD